MKTWKRLLVVVISAWCASGLSRAATHNVDIVGFAFSPPSLNINVNDTVVWTERDGAFHSTTSDTGLWDSGSLSFNGTFPFVFETAGTYPYHCTPHPEMRGSINVAGAPNSPPTVNITSPTNNAVVNAPANVTIEADAQDTDGTVVQVEFFDNTTAVGTDMTSPFSAAVTLSPGLHNLTAVATDNAGAKATSAVVIVKVPITNPIAERIPKGTLAVEVQTVADGMAAPIGMAVPDDGSGRIFVYDQAGQVWVVTAEGRLPAPLVDLNSRLVLLGAYDERGLLGMAVHPNFAQNPFIYTYTSEPTNGPADFQTVISPGRTNNHQSVIAEWRIDAANSNRVDVSSRREVMRIDQPQSNHNGGAMQFGPDGFLYVTLGDGGAADDEGEGHLPGGNAQDTNNILGKLIRIDVDARTSANGQYGVPADNPFVNAPGLDEIFAFGLRHPFSFSFDRANGTIYLADVGQNRIEEVDVITKGGNYGWSVKEGSFFFDANGAGAGFVLDAPVRPVPPNLIDPIAEYDHDDGLAVIGGYVYRGSQLATLQGRYVFGDWGNFATPSGRLFYLDDGNVIREFRLGLEDRSLGYWIRGFGEDTNGEVYVLVSRMLGPTGNTGKMLKLIAAPDAVAFTATSAGNGNVTNTWTGGLGPFALQRKQVVGEPFCGSMSFTTARVATSPNDLPSSFFRVADVARPRVIPFSAALSGLAERPVPLTNTASGLGLFALEGNTLRFDIQYSGLSGPAFAAHIHGPATAAEFANVLIDLSPYNGGAFGASGTMSGTILLSDSLKAQILAGLTYVNLHTTANPGGELRGQIAPVLMKSCLSGLAERPDPLSNAASGSGTFALVGTNLSFNVTYGGLSGPANAAHIHGPAGINESATVLINLAPYNTGAFGAAGSLVGTIGLTIPELALIVDGLTYVNFHTAANPGGEMRGQIVPQAAGVPLTASMSGFAERPTALTNTATGVGTFSLEGDWLTFDIRYDGLSGPATMGHIHGPAPASQATGVLVDLAPYNGGAWGSAGAISGSVLLTAAQKTMVLNGLSYVNLHTGANPGGEVRGQIAPVAMFSALSGVNERPAATYTSGIGSGTYGLVWSNLTAVVTYSNLTGAANAAHIHGSAGLLGSASVLVNLAPYNGGSFGAAGSVAGLIPLTADQLGSVIDLMTYVNFHTDANPGGEIRGQIFR